MQRISFAERGSRPPLRVGILLAHHFTLSAFAVFVDHLRLAADEGDRSRPLHVQWSIMASRPEPVPASCGVMLQPTHTLLPPDTLDYVVVIGGILHAGPQIDEIATRYLREVGATSVPLIGICTGSFILCRAGLMKGRRSCVSWYHYQDFLEAFPTHEVIADRLFLADGPRITCAGGAGAAALATYLIEQHLGRAVAQKASQVLLFDRTRSGSEVQPHPPLSESVAEPRVRRALLLMEQNLARSPSPRSPPNWDSRRGSSSGCAGSMLEWVRPRCTAGCACATPTGSSRTPTVRSPTLPTRRASLTAHIFPGNSRTRMVSRPRAAGCSHSGPATAIMRGRASLSSAALYIPSRDPGIIFHR
jgi:transcriptional regulator GlxA family with amidase domain